MKKLIIFVLTLFLTFTIFLSSKNANAEITPVTPFYEGDILNGQDLYLFTSYSTTPNFENGYISKKTISQQDIYYEENSYFNGWYKNLGQDLIDTYTEPEHEPENPYFYFYITFNNMLGQYMQLALYSLEPYEAEYIIKYSDDTTTTLTANQTNEYLLTTPQNETTKEVVWLCWSVYYPDYLASFRPLTAQLAYNFGFSSGESVGFHTGYNVGYNNGYHNGLEDAYQDDAQIQYVDIQNYNQLIQPRNNQEIINNVIFSYYDTGVIVLSGTSNNITRYLVATIRIQENHIYYLFGANNNSNSSTYYLQESHNGHRAFADGYRGIISTTNTDVNFYLYVMNNITTNGVNFYPKLIDLTAMYGEGNEPTLEVCNQIFNNSALYPYSIGTTANVGYYNGYSNGLYEGIEKGKDMQATQQLTSTGWISSIFSGISSLLNIQIFPGVTIGIIVGIPFVISLAYFVIRAFRGGGGA